MVINYKSFDLESKILVEREAVDRLYLRNKGELPSIDRVELVIKLHTSSLRHSNLFEIIRYVKLVELITGQFPLISLFRSRRKAWIELKVTMRGTKHGFLIFLLNKLYSKKKEFDGYLVVENFLSSKGQLALKIHELKFFDFLGKYQVVDEKLLAYWDVNIFVQDRLNCGDKLYFVLYNCMRGY